ncbi:MAG: amidohydrolase family protein, partial [Clostridia bacterium]|nr:amidohydrolase family protein [Clostridia bacterium]
KIVASGEITPPEACEIIDAGGLYAGPGLIDQHLHGFHADGEDFDMRTHCVEASMGHLRHGTTSVTPSIAYNYTYDEFISMIDQCNEAIAKDDTNIVGIHFEGPYTNPNYGSLRERAWTFDEAVCTELFDRAGKNVLHCTYAPEMPGAKVLEKIMSERNVIADIGHTCASPEDVERAVAMGATIVTHLYDAMGHYRGMEEACKATADPQETSSTLCLGTPGLYYELIMDSMGGHVRPYNARMAYRVGGEDHIILITDAGALGAGGGEDTPSETTFARADDLNFDINGELCGSFLTLNRACRNFMKVTGADIRIAFKCASTNPAKALGLYDRIGSIERGRDANIILVDDDFDVKTVIFRGEAL